MKVKFWVLVIVTGAVAVVLESSLIGLPWVVWWWWWLLEKVSWKELFWLSLGVGLVLDSLMVRRLGVSSLALLSAAAVLWWLREKVGKKEVEWLVGGAVAVGWSGFRGWGWGGGKVFAVILISAGLIFCWENMGEGRSIKLKR